MSQSSHQAMGQHIVTSHEYYILIMLSEWR